jgi:hypothetical protein
MLLLAKLLESTGNTVGFYNMINLVPWLLDGKMLFAVFQTLTKLLLASGSGEEAGSQSKVPASENEYLNL